MPYLSRCAIPMPLNQPLFIIEPQPVVEREPEVLDGLKRAHPQHLLLSVRINRSATPLPSGARTNAGLDVIPRNRSSAWKSSLIY